MGSTKKLGERAIITVEKYSTNQLNLNPTTGRECIIDCYVKGEGYSKIRLVSGTFTDIIGTRNTDLVIWSAGNLIINSSGTVTSDYSIKIDII